RNTVRHAVGTVSAITSESCPPWPGTRNEMFRHAIDVDGVTLVDFGVGDEAYKRDWMTKRREVYQLTCFAPSLKGRLLSLAKRGLLKLRAGRGLPEHAVGGSADIDGITHTV